MSNSKTYDSITLYLEDKSTCVDKITKYDTIIAALEAAAETAAASAHLGEYWFDNGQTRMKVVYRDVEALEKQITAFERLRQRCINRLNGRAVLLRDARGMKYNNKRY